MNVSVVLCTYNRAESLRNTLRSLAEQQVPAGLTWEVLVVDNNSTDHTRTVVQEAAGSLSCRHLSEPRQGKSFALNAAIPHVETSDVVVFTDDDVTMHTSWIGALWRAFAETDCAVVGGRVVPVWSCAKPRWYSDSGMYGLMRGAIVDYDHGDETRIIRELPFGANMAVRKGVFVRYGGFRTDLGPMGMALMRGEDTDFCRRVRAGGGSVLYVGDAIVYHPVDATRVRKTYFQSWYYYYGRMDVLMDPHKVTDHLWFGAPRYLVRELARAATDWFTTFEPKRRFYHRLECWRVMGQIAEYRRPSPLSA